MSCAGIPGVHMKGIWMATAAAVAALAQASSASAADLAGRPVLKSAPPVFVSAWTFETGLRYWYSVGRFRFNLGDPFVPGQLNSRLDYTSQRAHAAESFFRLDHASGVFIKGLAGGGSIVAGRMNDEDFPPAAVPYSNTLQSSRDGSLRYGGVDVGYVFWKQPMWQVEGLVGYHYWREKYNTYGCAQIAGNAGICGVVPPLFGPIPTSFNSLDQDIRVHSLRIGGAVKVNVTPQLSVRMEGAYLRSWFAGNDFHNFRPNIRGVNQSGKGDGFQLEGLVSYEVTPAFTIGAGARWWRAETANGRFHWENTIMGATFGVPSAPLPMALNRYGVFVQAAYTFGKTAGEAPGPVPFLPFLGAGAPRDWSGLHVGFNLGRGFGDGGGAVDAASPTAATFQALGRLPIQQKYGTYGFLAGGQIGYDWQFGRFVAGAEVDLSYAHIAGGDGLSDINTGLFFTTRRQNISWLGTARARLGFTPFGSTLIYATGGLAFGGVQTHSAFSSLVGGSCVAFFCSYGETSRTATGWTIGAGMERSLTQNLSLKTEYLYVDLGRQTTPVFSFGGANLAGVPVDYATRSNLRNHVFRSGLNYKFGWGGPAPVVAKY